MALARPSTTSEPLARGVIIHALQKALVAMWGEGELAKVVSRLPPAIAVATHGPEFEPLRWYPVAYLEAWHETVYHSAAQGDDAIYADYMDRALDITVGRVRRVLMKIMTPGVLAQRANDVWRYFHTHGVVTIDWRREDSARVRFSEHPFVENALGRLTFAEMVRYVLALSRVRNVRESHGVDGAGRLVLTLSWDAAAEATPREEDSGEIRLDPPVARKTERRELRRTSTANRRSVRPETGTEPFVRGGKTPTTVGAAQASSLPPSGPPTLDLRPGEAFGRYKVTAVIGRGGMGVVYRAHDTHLDRSVAVKVLHGDPSPELARESAAARLLREGRAAAALVHPNVVTIFDVGESNGVPYIAMELIDGSTLRTFVGDARRSLSQRIAWLVDVAVTLAEAHERGIIHRDVKPENVIVSRSGAVKVLDFGIARRAPGGVPVRDDGPVTRESTVFGSPMYMAPEQLRGEPLDGRADQFAWGMMSYELLTGRHPWESAASDAELARWIAVRDVRRPSSIEPRIPAALDALLMRTLRKRQGDRYPSMRHVIAELRALAPLEDGALSSAELRAVSARPQSEVATRTLEIDSVRDSHQAPTKGRARSIAVVAAAVITLIVIAFMMYRR